MFKFCRRLFTLVGINCSSLNCYLIRLFLSLKMNLLPFWKTVRFEGNTLGALHMERSPGGTKRHAYIQVSEWGQSLIVTQQSNCALQATRNRRLLLPTQPPTHSRSSFVSRKGSTECDNSTPTGNKTPGHRKCLTVRNAHWATKQLKLLSCRFQAVPQLQMNRTARIKYFQWFRRLCVKMFMCRSQGCVLNGKFCETFSVVSLSSFIRSFWFLFCSQ
jgi:hypothetical protein